MDIERVNDRVKVLDFITFLRLYSCHENNYGYWGLMMLSFDLVTLVRLLGIRLS